MCRGGPWWPTDDGHLDERGEGEEEEGGEQSDAGEGGEGSKEEGMHDEDDDDAGARCKGGKGELEVLRCSLFEKCSEEGFEDSRTRRARIQRVPLG